MALDGSDNTYLTGADDVVAKMNATGTALEYITYLGGSNGAGWGIAVDSAGDAYVSGYAGSDFPIDLQCLFDRGQRLCRGAQSQRLGLALFNPCSRGSGKQFPQFR